MTINYKKTILIDLDGVLNTYRGNYEENFIPAPKEDVDKFLEKLYEIFDIKIFTTRNKLLTENWLINNNLSRYITGVTNIKEPAYLMVDDRCVCFDGNFDNTIKQIDDFRVWYKK